MIKEERTILKEAHKKKKTFSKKKELILMDNTKK
jgi:hypothetical protein